MLDFASRPSLPLTDREFAYRRQYITRSDIAHFIRRNAKSIAVPILIGIAAAALYLLLAPPIYTARAQLLIDPKLPQLLREGAGDSNLQIDSPQVESQIAVLRSSEVALAVIDKLGLLENPEFQGRPGPSSLSRWVSSPKAVDSLSDDQRRLVAISRFDAGLDIRRVGISYAIDIYFSALNPALAARIANATAEAYLQNLLDTRVKASKVASEWLEERITHLRTQMNNAARRVQEFRASQDYRIVKKGDRPASAADPSAPGTDMEPATLEELDATAQTYRKIYESFYQAFTEAVQRESYPASNARVISKATAPGVKSHPKTILVLAFGTLLGSLVGFGLAFVRHSLEQVVRSSQQIREEIGLECLGVLPRIGVSVRATLLARARRALSEAAENEVAFSAVVNNPYSAFSDGVKHVKTSLLLASKMRTLRCIGITSVSAGEGKSTTAVNLATLYAASGTSTLLIDGDLRSGMLSRHFAPNATVGILNVLAGKVELAGAVTQIERLGLDFLPVNLKPDQSDQSELMASEQMSAMLRQACENYAVVIVDLAPLTMVAETVAVSSFLDAVAVVVEWEVTLLSLLAEVVHTLNKAQATIAGAIITKVNVRANEAYTKPTLAYRGRGYSDDG